MTDVDPYLPPTADVEDAPRPIVRAGRWRRFGTLIVDHVVMFVLLFVVMFVAALTLGREAIMAVERMPSFVLGSLLSLNYYLFFEGLWARTPGKVVLGTVVVDEGGMKPRFRRIVGRTLCRFIPFEPLSFFGSRGWHDRIPRTHVVLTRPPPEAVEFARKLGSYPPPR